MNKLVNKYLSMSIELKAGFWFLFCNLVQKGIQFITVPIFTRLLTTEQYGQYTLFQSWYSIISIFATLNLSAGVFNNGMVKYEDRRDQYVSSMQGLTTCISTLLFIPLISIVILMGISNKYPYPVIILMFIEFMTYTAFTFWSVRCRFEYLYRKLVIITVGFLLISTIISLLWVFYSNNKGIARIESVLICNIVIGIVFYIYNFCKGKCFYNKEFWRFALKFNLPLIPHYLSMVFLNQIDRIIINYMCNEKQVAIYSLANSISLIINVVITSINSAYIPWIYGMLKEKQEIDYNKIRNISNYIFLAVCCLTLIPMIFGPEIMAIMGPSEYQEGAWLIIPLSLSTLFVFLYSVLLGNVEFYFEKSTYTLIASSISAVLNIITNYIFIAKFGYFAAAYTTLLCYIVMALLHYYFNLKICKKENIKFIYSVKSITLMIIAVVLLSLIIALNYNYKLIRYSILILLLCSGMIIYKKSRKIFK